MGLEVPAFILYAGRFLPFLTLTLIATLFL